MCNFISSFYRSWLSRSSRAVCCMKHIAMLAPSAAGQTRLVSDRPTAPCQDILTPPMAPSYRTNRLKFLHSFRYCLRLGIVLVLLLIILYQYSHRLLYEINHRCYVLLLYIHYLMYGLNHGQKTTGQKPTGQKTTKNANPGQCGHKTTRTKDHQDKRPPSTKFLSLHW